MKERSVGELKMAFNEAYAALNPAQKQAVDTIEGPVMVIAGPGTGKTQILALRIANILISTDTVPESILALTFTDAGAVNMRERLRRFLGAVAYRIPIFTFHAFCENLIRSYPEAYERIVGGRLANDVELSTVLESILESGTFIHLRPHGNPTLHISTILRQLSELKRENIGPDELAKLIADQEAVLSSIEKLHTKGAHKGKVRSEYSDQEKVIARNSELLTVFRQYEAVLKENHWYDYNDMVLETIRALESNEEILFAVQEQYQYVLADEHQDVNASQNRILELLTSYHEQPNIFVVGDEKQAIFRFQGASLENFLYFSDSFGATTTIALTENYRSGQRILDVAHSLIRVEDGPLKDLRVPLHSNTSNEGVIIETTYPHQAVEDEALVAQVAKTIEEGVAPETIAVIMRDNRDVELVSERLRAAGIPVSATADRDVLSNPITETIVALMSLVVRANDTPALAALLHQSFINIDRSDLVRVLSAQSYEKPLYAVISDERELAAVGVVNPQPFLRFVAAINGASQADGIEPPHRVLAKLLDETGFRDHVALHEPTEGTRLVRRIYDAVEMLVRSNEAASLRSVLEILERHRRYHVSFSVPSIPARGSAVQVMTAHKAKGLEFDVVFAPHLLDSTWGASRRSSFFRIPLARTRGDMLSDEYDDERRLFYVVLTRARRSVYLSSARQNLEGKDRPPSRFLEELERTFLDVRDASEAAATFEPLNVLKSQPVSGLDGATFSELLRQRGVSATSLNNYHKSPWTFLYRNLLRMPEVQSEALLFGNLIHGVLEAVTRSFAKHGKVMSATEVKQQIERELGKLPLSKPEFVRLHARSFEVLVPYIEHIMKSIPASFLEEFKLSVKFETGLPEFPEVLLTGKLDRLDIGEDGRVLRVVDYKSGKPKTRGQIEGSTKDSDGDYKRQLVFYALLLELHGDERLLTRNGTISFVEPKKDGTIREESFVVTGEDIAALKEDIVNLVRTVTSGSFLDDRCDPERCDYCHLVDQLRAS